MKKTFTAITTSSILAAAIISASTPALAGSSEKCADIAKAGKNGCEANGHSVQGNLLMTTNLTSGLKFPLVLAP